MARDGSGVHSLPAGYLAVTGQTVLPSNHNPPLEDLSAAITESIARTGVTAIVADIPFAGFRLTGLGDAQADTDALNRQTADDRYLYQGKGLLFGYTLSNNVADANNDIDIVAGVAKDDTGAVEIVLGSGLTKRLDGSWAVGTGNGGLDTGSKSINSSYHVFAIKRSDTGVVDSLLSLSATAPTMPASYDYKRRIGSILTNGSGNIIAFFQKGDDFSIAPITNYNSTANGALITQALSVPLGIVVIPKLISIMQQGTAGDATVQVAPVGFSAGAYIVNQTNLASDRNGVSFEGPPTNTSAQILFVTTVASGTITTGQLSTRGWIDTRGRDA